MQNLDPTELAKFSQGQWWDETDPTYAMLHRLNPIRLQFIEAHTTLKDQLVVDLGCGGGILTEALAKAGAIATGVDLNEEALTQAAHHAHTQHLEIEYHKLPIETFAQLHPEKFAVVTCMEMLEHVPDPASIVQAAAQLVKPDGMVFFSTINRTLRSYLEAVVGAEYLLKLLPKGTHDYQKFIKPSELCDAARACSLTLVALNGLNYQSFEQTFSLQASPAVNYLAAFKKI